MTASIFWSVAQILLLFNFREPQASAATYAFFSGSTTVLGFIVKCEDDFVSKYISSWGDATWHTAESRGLCDWVWALIPGNKSIAHHRQNKITRMTRRIQKYRCADCERGSHDMNHQVWGQTRTFYIECTWQKATFEFFRHLYTVGMLSTQCLQQISI